MLRIVLAALALMLVSPTAAAAKDVVVVKLRDGSAAKPVAGKPRASKRKVVKKRQRRARKPTRAAQRTHEPTKPKRKRVELRPMP